MEDEKIIELFFERSEQALKELDIKYGRVCHKLSFGILNDHMDAEECVNDAYLGAWNAIPPTNPNPLQELEAYLSAPNTVEAEIEARELAHIIESFLDTLTVENRVIFMWRYAYLDTYEDIAKHVGITEKNVSVRLTRIRRQMKAYLIEREVFV